MKKAYCALYRLATKDQLCSNAVAGCYPVGQLGERLEDLVISLLSISKVESINEVYLEFVHVLHVLGHDGL